MKLLDTNIVIYGVGRDHPYKKSCAQLLEQVREGNGEFIIDAELLQEILYVYTNRRERQRGLSIVNDLLNAFPDPLPITRHEIVVAHGLMLLYPALGPRDAIHAAVVQTQRLEGIVTADRIFKQLGVVTAFDPRDITSGF